MGLLLLHNANIITMDPKRPRASWVLACDGAIVAAGASGAEARERLDRVREAHPQAACRIVDCEGVAVVPGFIDAHCHLLAFARRLDALDVGPANAASVADVQRLVREAARKAPPGAWVTAYGYDQFWLKEKRHVTRWELDDAAPGHPVRLMHRSGHVQLVNSAALGRLGISVESEDPPGGMIDREVPSCEPNGLLYGMDRQISAQVATSPGAQRPMAELIGRAGGVLASKGVTALHDATERNDASRLESMAEWKRAGLIPQRLRACLGYEAFADAQGEGAFPELAYGVKLVVDGSMGRMVPDQAELEKRVGAVHAAGMPLAVHAIEQRHIEAVCTAVEKARAGRRGPAPSHGRPLHRIEHCSVCPPDLARRIAADGIAVATQPVFIYQDGERYLRSVREGDLPHLYAIRTLLDAGVCVAGSSDSPIAPADPILGIAAAVARLTRAGNPVRNEQGTTVREALALYTVNAARAVGLGSSLGSITGGKMADFAILDADPFEVGPRALRDITVTMTVCSGEVVYSR